MFDIGPNLRMNVWLIGDVEIDAVRMRNAYDAVREWLTNDQQARERIMPPVQNAPQTPQNRPQGRPSGGGGQRRQQPGSGFYCAEHRVEVQKTPAQYDKDGDRYQHDFPPGQTGPQGGKRHYLYYRQLVGANGQPLPPLEMGAPYTDEPSWPDEEFSDDDASPF